MPTDREPGGRLRRARRGRLLAVLAGAVVSIAGGTWAVAADAGPAGRTGATVPGTECTITGTPGNDVLRGTPRDDVICGLGGRDVLLGFGGNDLLVGGRGDDTLVGGPGNDRLFGDSDDDLLVDRLGANAFHGGPG